MKFSISQASRQGARRYNQDRLAYAYGRDSLLMVVADGMGGHFHGELAAQIAVQLVTDAFQKHADPTLDAPLDFLHDSLIAAHNGINDYSLAHRLTEFPRTTCVACVVQEGAAYWAHTGDSRLYYFRDGKLRYRTRDHSLVQRLFEEGQISAGQMTTHPERNKIYSCLGGGSFPEVALSQEPVMRENDVILLCSDGLWGQFEFDEIAAILDTYPLTVALPELLDNAELRGGRTGDNLSAVAMRWGDERRFFSDRAMSAATVPLGASVSSLEPFHDTNREAPLSTDEIEYAVAEVQAIIRKYSK
ncbi:MAG: serine/threonine-protein phosphatase [Sulfuricella sp.]|nr:serine/threonine-protein phosphatase [Sulfuricella sp.]